MDSKKRRICVIGAGATGLCSLRHLTCNSNFDVIGFEQNEQLGGIWVYNEKVERANYREEMEQSPMYCDMRTNLPIEVMGYPDFPFSQRLLSDEECPKSFVHHSTVLQYLEDYADHFQLKKYIKFGSRVRLVKPRFEENSTAKFPRILKWEVTTEDSKDKVEETDSNGEVYEFDNVIVCNGHFSKAAIPGIPDIENFKGKIIHSQDYRRAEEFSGQNVVIVGCGPSGTDIMLEIAKVANQVVISTRRTEPLTYKLPSNVRQMGLVKSTFHNGFIFNQFGLRQDNEIQQPFMQADAIVLCTGYSFSLPFLAPECKVEILEDGKLISPLYRHMIHIAYPSLCFIGLPNLVVPFVLSHCQILYYISYLEGRVQLPSYADMKKELESSQKMSHVLGPSQWAYDKSLIKDSNFGSEKLNPIIFGCSNYSSLAEWPAGISLLERLEIIRSLCVKVD